MTTDTYTMFCLPPAGSSSAIYASWKQLALDTLTDTHINIVPIEYPGHGSKSDKPLINDPDILAQEIAQTIIAHNINSHTNNINSHTNKKTPYILFGHSVGAALLWKVMDYLREEGATEELALVVVSSRPENQYLQHIKGRYKLTDEEIIVKLKNYNNFPDEILQNKEALAYFLSIIRSDFYLSDQLLKERITKIKTPLVAFFGVDDPDIPEKIMMEGWQQHSEIWLGCFILEGDHFYFLNKNSLKKMLKQVEVCLLHEV